VQSIVSFHMSLENAIVETLAYSDVFDYPLTAEELCRYLGVSASQDDVKQCADSMELVNFHNGYYFLNGRDAIVQLRKERNLASAEIFKRAIFYGRILGNLPFIRMVALTGSLAVRNCDEAGDYDYMLVAKPGRVWLARAFALFLNRIANLFGEILCPNLIVSENMLEWKSKDLYTARELEQMVLISGEDVYCRLRVVNEWIKHYLPNVIIEAKYSFEGNSFFPKIIEFFLQGALGNRFETWEMHRKIDRFSKQAGFGNETNFNADICQGNFNHHGLWTMREYEKRLQDLRVVS
jgi:hypothetical protein